MRVQRAGPRVGARRPAPVSGSAGLCDRAMDHGRRHQILECRADRLEHGNGGRIVVRPRVQTGAQAVQIGRGSRSGVNAPAAIERQEECCARLGQRTGRTCRRETTCRITSSSASRIFGSDTHRRDRHVCPAAAICPMDDRVAARWRRRRCRPKRPQPQDRRRRQPATLPPQVRPPGSVPGPVTGSTIGFGAAVGWRHAHGSGAAPWHRRPPSPAFGHPRARGRRLPGPRPRPCAAPSAPRRPSPPAGCRSAHRTAHRAPGPRAAPWPRCRVRYGPA